MLAAHLGSIIDAAQGFFAPRPDEMAWKWAEKNIFLPATEAQRPGPYRTDLVPFVREPLEVICRDQIVTDIALMWAAQTTKTTLINAAMCYRISNSPRNMLYVMPSTDLARSFSVTRWQPIAKACPPVAELISQDRHAFKNLEQDFTNCFLHFVGSNSAANLSSRPVPDIFQDETDKQKEATTKEASASELADQRCKTFANPKKLKTSTPTTEHGIINREFLSGDQREYFTPCPNCGEFILLKFEQIKWPRELKLAGGWDMEAVKRAAYYECQECGFHIHDGHKTKMNRAGEWQPQNPFAPASRRSYHLASWQAPWASCTFGNTAFKYLHALKTFTMQNFDNSEAGRPSKVDAQTLDWEILAARREPYELGEPPAGVAVVTAFADIQDSWIEFFAWGWGEGLENWVLEHEIIHADPSKPGAWEALTEIILRDRPLPLDWTFIDYGGHRGQEAIEYSKAMAGQRVYLHKGSSNPMDPVNGRVTTTKKPKQRLFLTGVSNAKRAVFSMMNTPDAGPGYCHYPAALDEEFFKQLCSEELRTKYEQGAPKEFWFQTRKRNESLDGFVGCYASYKRLTKARINRRFEEMNERQAAAAAPPVSEENEPGETAVIPPQKKRRSRRAGKPRGWITPNN